VFLIGMQKVKDTYVYSDLINAENKEHVQALERCFLWLKLDQGSWAHLYTLS
jgi:hypothetical protein